MCRRTGPKPLLQAVSIPGTLVVMLKATRWWVNEILQWTTAVKPKPQVPGFRKLTAAGVVRRL